jgi:hypothetical protein
MPAQFTTSYDADYEGYIVHEASSAYSFARIPASFRFLFNTKAEALEQVRRLNKWLAKGNRVDTRNIETPARFERVADTKYGVAW